MLSSQTIDRVTNASVDHLKSALGGTLSIDNVIAADRDLIYKAITVPGDTVGFASKKAESESSTF